MSTLTQTRSTRRDFLAATGATLAGFAAAGRIASASAQSNASGSAATSAATRKRALRIAHLTDVHVQPELKADQGLIACLKHVQSQPDKPDLILNGGDAIMDSFGHDQARTKLLWGIWKGALKSDCGVPVQSCIGNHDIWGWNKREAKTTGAEPQYGKQWAMDELGLSRPYHSFDRAGWHFIALDGVQPFGEDGYIGRIDDEQFAWLQSDLKSVAAGTPILLWTHIPIFSIAAFVNDTHDKEDWRVSGGVMHIDAIRMQQLFLKFPNVKLCLSGHLHLVDRVDYTGVTYFCDGAVSGAWWKGDHHECKNGYAMLNLYDDGSFEREYVTYGWQAVKEETTTKAST